MIDWTVKSFLQLISRSISSVSRAACLLDIIFVMVRPLGRATKRNRSCRRYAIILASDMTQQDGVRGYRNYDPRGFLSHTPDAVLMIDLKHFMRSGDLTNWMTDRFLFLFLT